jgi:hypothetical protein
VYGPTIGRRLSWSKSYQNIIGTCLIEKLTQTQTLFDAIVWNFDHTTSLDILDFHDRDSYEIGEWVELVIRNKNRLLFQLPFRDIAGRSSISEYQSRPRLQGFAVWALVGPDLFAACIFLIGDRRRDRISILPVQL